MFFHRTWKYWHSAMNHGKKLAITTAYDIYLELAEGVIDPQWRVKKPVDFHRFHEKLALQMLKYSPADKHYAGDEKHRASTKLPMKRRNPPPATHNSSSSSSSTLATTIQEQQPTRLCGDLGLLHNHLSSMWSHPKNSRLCMVCGMATHQHCALCDNAPLHYYATPDGFPAPCFFLYHDTGFSGLARSDCKTMGTPVKQWKKPNNSGIKRHRKRVLNSNNSQSTLPDSRSGNSSDNEMEEEDGVDPDRVL